MKVSLDIPWQRYALIAELAQRCEGKCPQFGKTVLQKMVYLLQEVFHIDCGYDFDIYAYGPFTPQLLQDLDLVEHTGAVKIHPVVSMTGGYEISPGGQAAALIEKGSDFLNKGEVKKAIETLVDEFGHFWAKDLELRSTIIFVQRDSQKQGKLLSADDIVEIVKQIKPKFTNAEIRDAVEELKAKKYLEPVA
jgi:uncharacterized protein YwgA